MARQGRRQGHADGLGKVLSIVDEYMLGLCCISTSKQLCLCFCTIDAFCGLIEESVPLSFSLHSAYFAKK